VNAASFQATYARFKTSAAEEAILNLDKENTPAPLSPFRLRRQLASKKAALERQKRLWTPFRRCLPLQGA